MTAQPAPSDSGVAVLDRPEVTWTRWQSNAAFTLHLTPDEVADRLERAVEALPQFALREVGAGAAELSRRTNLVTWGAVITMTWTATEGGTAVTIATDNKVRTMLGDYGQGRRDIITIFDALVDAQA